MENNDKNKNTPNSDAATGVETPPPPQIMNPSSHKELEDKKAPEGKTESTRKPEDKKSDKTKAKK